MHKNNRILEKSVDVMGLGSAKMLNELAGYEVF